MRPEIVKYLPDIKPEADKFIDREFFFNVVNTCDTAFFPKQIKKLEEEQKRVAMQQQQQTIEVEPELLQLLESYGKS